MWNPFAKRALSGARSCRPRWGSALLACAITLAVGTPLAHAQQEYAPDNTEWNGLSELMALAEENHIRSTRRPTWTWVRSSPPTRS
jgi:hypothetical protein